MVAMLESVVVKTMDDLTNSGYVFATERIESLPELAELPDSDFEELLRPFGEELQSALKLHRTIALYMSGGKGDTGDRALVAGGEPQWFELAIAHNQEAAPSLTNSSMTCKIVPHKRGGAVLGISDQYICGQEDYERRAHEELTHRAKTTVGAKSMHRGASHKLQESTHGGSAGYILLHEKLEEPADFAVLINKSQLVRLALTDFSLRQLSLSARIIVRLHPTPGLAELVEAFHNWMEGAAFTAVPEHVLDKIDIKWLGATRNPWLNLFVGMNFFKHGRLNEAASCYLTSFRDDAMADIDECCFLNEEVEDRTGMALLALCEKTSISNAQGVVFEVLTEWYKERQQLLVDMADDAATTTKIPTLPWEHAAAIVIAGCDMVHLTEAQVHMLLFYAEGLCIRHFGQRLLAEEPHAKRDGLMYVGVDTNAAFAQANKPQAVATIQGSLLPKCAHILRAVCEIAHDVSTHDWHKLLAHEPVWLSSALDAVVPTVAMTHLFRPDMPQSAMFARVEQCYQKMEYTQRPI